MADEQDAYHLLCAYTLNVGDAAFLHQHVVDAWAAQTANGTGPPIRLAFALIGLYLHVERGLTGRQVQLAHMTLARQRRAWPAFPLPLDRGSITVADVLAASEGPNRAAMIRAWSACVWEQYRETRGAIEALLNECRFVVGG